MVIMKPLFVIDSWQSPIKFRVYLRSVAKSKIQDS